MKAHLVLFATLVLVGLIHIAEPAPASTGQVMHKGHHAQNDVPFYPEDQHKFARSYGGIEKRDCARCCNDFKCAWFMQGPCGCH